MEFDVNSNCETALQLLSRLQNRPSLNGVLRELFPNGLSKKEIVEINGESGSGKSKLTLQIVKEVLKLEIDVVYLNTDNQFNYEITENRERLHIIDVYNSTMLFATAESLIYFLSQNPNVGLIVVDPISAFYWQDNLEFKRMNDYVSKVVEQICRPIKDFDVTFIYTRPECFKSKKLNIECSNIYDLTDLNTVIELKNDVAILQKSNERTIFSYNIVDSGIVFIKK